MSNFKKFDWKIQRFFQFSETWTGKEEKKGKGIPVVGSKPQTTAIFTKD